jgi:hypothetical protein
MKPFFLPTEIQTQTRERRIFSALCHRHRSRWFDYQLENAPCLSAMTQVSGTSVARSQGRVHRGLNILHLMTLSYGLCTFRHWIKLDLKLAPGDIC